MPYGRTSNQHDQEDSADSGPRRITHLTRSSESERGIVYLARLRITDMIIATSSLPYLSNLVLLRLQDNRLTDLPPQIFRLPSLRELDVSQNLLTEISGLIGMLAPTLEELFLQSNHLQSLPQQLGRLKRLRLLDIADNRLGCIPVEVQRLVSESSSSERRRIWRLYESSLGQGNDDTQPTAEGSHHAGGALHSTPIEEGGHEDDDDYVQIRQGMKCWAGDNWFWNAKVSRPTALMSPMAATTTMLLAGPVSSPTSSISSTSSSSLSSAQHSPIATSPPNHIGSPLSTIPLRTSTKTISFSSRNNSTITGDWPDIPHRHHHHSGPYSHHQDKSPYYYQQTTHHHHQHQGGLGLSEHLIDRRGYCKDSYTSCSWTLSLVDICSQIVGQKLHDDPHYYCHRETCPFKSRRRAANRTTRAKSSSLRDHTRMDRKLPSGVTKEEEEEGCTVNMMPEWMIEQLGLHHLSEIRKSLHSPNSCSHSVRSAEGTEAIAGSFFEDDDDSGRTSFSHGNRPGILDVPAPMQLTQEEKEMECEFCSVCRSRLYFSGMRWKDVGVMDKKMVPLEWVACSVQCRSRAEREERRKSHGNSNQATTPTSTTAATCTVTSAIVAYATALAAAAEALGSSENQAGADPAVSGDTNGGEGGAVSALESRAAFPNGMGTSTRANTLGSHQYSPTQPLDDGDDGTTSEIPTRVSGPGPVPAPAPPMASQDSGTILREELNASPVAMEETLGTRETVTRNQQRDYRATMLYGLIKSRALRRRTRALSL